MDARPPSNRKLPHPLQNEVSTVLETKRVGVTEGLLETQLKCLQDNYCDIWRSVKWLNRAPIFRDTELRKSSSILHNILGVIRLVLSKFFYVFKGWV